MTRSVANASKSADTAERAKPAERKPLPPLNLPKHLKPLTGPTGMKPSY